MPPASLTTESLKTENYSRGAAHRNAMAKRSREQSESVAEIGALPDVVDPARKEACHRDLRLFLTTYFPQSTGLKPFSVDHDRVIERIQLCILDGGRFCNAVYRGFAKTTISENAAIWATFYGHRRYVAVFGADQSAADGNIDSIKRELDSNELLLADFPEICFAVHALEGKHQRQQSQTYQGQLTHIEWKADSVVFPTIDGSAASGSILAAYGLTSASRGMKYKRVDGTQQRLDFCIIDDPQTDESAASPLQVGKRLKVIKKSIMKSSGHFRRLAAVVNATVIEPDDLVCQLLDPQKNAAWQGERIKLVKKWADAHETFWLKDYADARTTYDKDDPHAQRQAHALATELYLRHRAAADAGCSVSWEHCFDPETEVSAIQHAYNALIDDGPEVFASEYQNEPLAESTAAEMLSADEIARKVNGYGRGEVPPDVVKITAFIDVQQDLLFYLVAGWAPDFTGYVLDYGTYPDQQRERFSKLDVRKTLGREFPGTGLEGWLRAGLDALTATLLAAKWQRADGAALGPDLPLLVDANWGESTETVYKFCAERSAAVMPSHGKAVAAGQFFNDRVARPGERRGLNWRIPPLDRGRTVRHVLFDPNAWKSFANKRLAVKYGDPGSLTLFKAAPARHAMIAGHWTAETPTTVAANGRTSQQWRVRPGHPDNDWLDCLVGNYVAASLQGIQLPQHRLKTKPLKKRPRKRVSYLEA